MKRALALLLALGLSHRAWALGQENFVSETSHTGDFPLAGAVVAVDSADWPGVARAAGDLRSDLAAVFGKGAGAGRTILVGTLGKSPAIDRLAAEGRIDVSGLRGTWEAYEIETVEDMLVVAGADKRGTIYGLYEISEQMGVSPWTWWADVPVAHRDALYVAAGRHYGKPPAVKYRGIFLNDEAPALSGWAKERYGTLDHRFYEKVFELILRLRGNFLWPAMWDNAFNEDDPLNPRIADEYGIVMGTSHHEPMLRAQQEWKRHGTGPWNYATNGEVLRGFWAEGIRRNKDYESIVTLGMRGDGDMPMTADEQSADTALLEKIVADQRTILAREAPKLPQVWALYKEVQLYYEKGMRVPDDVTLLWSDDNWGDLRRLPTAEERSRPGGAGIYYHFDYVGDPRNYKWINTNQISKVDEQMSLAWRYGADRIWVVNVGDLKPMEFPTEFFLTLARDPDGWPAGKLDEFTQAWAAREFGAAYAGRIAAVVTRRDQLVARRKPELLDADTFSQTAYREADRVVAEYDALEREAEQLGRLLPAERQDAYFELVLHPLKAAAIVTRLYAAVGRNHLYAAQGRVSANLWAAEARALFAADRALGERYNHALAGGKWNHMMDQTHIGYTGWQQPDEDEMPDVREIALPDVADMGVAAEAGDFDVYDDTHRFIDVYAKGRKGFDVALHPSAPWIRLDAASGRVDTERRFEVSIDWAKLPVGESRAEMRIDGAGKSQAVPIRAVKPPELAREDAAGFVESGGYVSIEAEHYSARTDVPDASWRLLPDYGRTLSAMEPYPGTAPSREAGPGSPRLDYRLFLFSPGEVTVRAICGSSLDFVSGRGLRYGVSFDDEAPQIVDIVADHGRAAWEKSVSDNARVGLSHHRLSGTGYHMLKIWMIDPGLPLEKLVVDLGGLQPSYLGPPESYRGGAR
jgi:hypothetical protein